MKRIAPRIVLALLLFCSVGNVTATARIQDKTATDARALTWRCATFVRDAHPPANVRSTPNGAIVRTLPNDVELRVDEDRSGWLRISSPAMGWIHVSVTTVYCGSKSLEDQDAVMGALDRLGTRAQTDQRAADTLMRYQVFGAADGYAGETASDELAALMVTNPKLLIAVLDQLPEARREDTMRGLVLTGSANAARVRAFGRATSEEPMHPTSITWKRLAQKCGRDLARLPYC